MDITGWRNIATRRLTVTAATGALIAALCLSGLPTSVATGAPPLSVWDLATPPSPTGNWYSVDFVNGQWIVLGHGGEIAVSHDGSTWSEHPVPTGSWQSVAYGNGEYVALSSDSSGPEEMISTNGINWTPVPGPAGPWTDLTFGAGRFVAVSDEGQIVTSTDGQNWTLVWSHRPFDLTSITYGDGHYVAVDAAQGATLISANGSDWSAIFAPRSGLKWSAVAYGNGNFVAFDSSAGLVETSVYGYVWTLHSYSPAQETDAATFGCGSFVAVGQPTGTTNNVLSSVTGETFSASAVPADASSNWTAVGYGAHRFVAVDSTGNIAWSNSRANCAAVIPSAPQQVSGNIRSGQVWTYMHPSAHPGGAPVTGYRVTISDGSVTKECDAAVFFQPNCIIRGLTNREVYSVTTQAHNRFGYSAPTDAEFAIPVASWSFDAVTNQSVISQTSPIVVQVTGVVANSQGVYPVSVITVHFGSQLAYCRHPNPFGECLVTIADPPVGRASIYATYTGYGRSYRSPTSYVTITP